MPCMDGRESEERNAMMRFCCETLTAMADRGEPIPDYIACWWRQHQEWDAEHGRPHKKGQHRGQS